MFLSTVYRTDWLKLTPLCFFSIQSVLSVDGYLIYFSYIFFDSYFHRGRLHSEISIFSIFWFHFQSKSYFYWRRQTIKKSCLAEEELDGFDIDGIRNLQNLPGLLFIDEEYGNLEAVVDGGERTRNINK